MKNLTWILLVGSLLLVSIEASTRDRQRTVRFGNFGDYLVKVVAPKTRPQNQASEPAVGSTTTESPAEQAEDDGEEESQTEEDILGYFRDVPRQHWSCCMLGILAGKKGFHCQVNYYAARIAKRNNNRAHSNKMMFHGSDGIENWGRDIMTTFSRCISHEEGEFHRCCRTATVERREIHRWQTSFRHMQPQK